MPNVKEKVPTEDPMNLLNGMSNMFVAYHPPLEYENNLDFSDDKLSKLPCVIFIRGMGNDRSLDPQQILPTTQNIHPRAT